MSAPAEELPQKFSHEEYFALEAELDQKFEYIAGEAFAMTGGSINHALIGKNTTTALDIALKNTSCIALNSDAKLCIDEVDSFFYPDAMVLCEEAEIEDTLVKSPQIIIEVLSATTEDYDHGKKFASYRQIVSLQTYVMLHQNKPCAEVFQRCKDNAWLFNEYTGLDVIIALNDDLQLAMADLYQQVRLP